MGEESTCDDLYDPTNPTSLSSYFTRSDPRLKEELARVLGTSRIQFIVAREEQVGTSRQVKTGPVSEASLWSSIK